MPFTEHDNMGFILTNKMLNACASVNSYVFKDIWNSSYIYVAAMSSYSYAYMIGFYTRWTDEQ